VPKSASRKRLAQTGCFEIPEPVAQGPADRLTEALPDSSIRGMSANAGRWHEQDEVLCVRLDTIGDVLMTTPALRALREQRPGRRITLLTSPAGVEVAGLVPEVDRAIAYEAPWMKPDRADPSPRADCALVERLRAAAFDAAAIFTTYTQSALPAALACHLAGIPRRLAHSREKPYRLLTDWVPESEPERGVRHEAQRQLDLVAAVGAETGHTGLSLRVPPASAAAALARLREAGHDPREPWLLLHPGAMAESRRYPPELYAEAMRPLAARTGRRIVVSGDGSERPLVESLAKRLGPVAVPMAGRLSLAELCGLIAAAPLLVCNNTGPAHVAAALGTPVVVLYALTNPQHTPWQVPSRVLSHDVPCRWCLSSVCPEGHHACLRMVPPPDVAAAALELLGSGGAGTLPAQGRISTGV
jgi:lipopolysaccharide heptosyltransferase II